MMADDPIENLYHTTTYEENIATIRSVYDYHTILYSEQLSSKDSKIANT